MRETDIVRDQHERTVAKFQEAARLNQEAAQNYRWVGIILMAAVAYDFLRKKKR